MFSNPWTMWRSLVLSAQSLQQHWHLKCVLKDKADLMKHFFLPLSVFFPVNIKNVFECSVFSCRLPVDTLVTSLRNNIWVMSHSIFFLLLLLLLYAEISADFNFEVTKLALQGRSSVPMSLPMLLHSTLLNLLSRCSFCHLWQRCRLI